MSINERRVGRTGAAWKTLALGTLGAAVLIAIATVLPNGTGGAAVGLVPVIVMYRIAQSRQHAIVQAHLDAGGKRGSGWAAFGLGLACLVPVLVISVIFALLTDA